MRIAVLSTDDRENRRRYTETNPIIPTPQEALLQGFALLTEHEFHFVSCLQRSVRSPAKLAPNVYFHSLLVPKIGWMKTAFQGCVRAVRSKLREIQPAVVHGHGTERDCAISAVFSGFPNVLTVHGNMRRIARLNHARPFSYEWLAARLEGFVLPRADGVVCITNHTREEVKDLVRRTWVLPNAVDKNFFDVQAGLNVSGPPMGLCVGTILPLKNQNALIHALDPLAREKNFKIVFAGKAASNEYGEEFGRLVRERSWCEHLGFLNREQLKAQLARASFVILPTLEDNCPMVVLEAMAAGVPVLASKVGGVPDLINDGATGLFCDPQRPESFREAVNKLLSDRPWAQQLAVTAKAEALRRFHPQVIATEHLRIYEQLRASHSAR